MTDREKLIELIDEGRLKRAGICYDNADCIFCKYDADGVNCGDGIIADHLLANGVVVREKGEWKYIGGDEWCCSVCGYVVSTEGRWEPMMDDFCRGCGSDMRKEKPEA